MKELLAEDEAAIDQLLTHDADDRYSFSVNSSRDYNVSVSQACQWIAREKVLCYEPEMRVITRSQFVTPFQEDPFGRTKETFATWWSENKRRGLATLQTEALDGAIKFMTEVDGTTALTWHPDAPRLPLDEFNRRRDQNLKTLAGIRSYVVATGTPYRPKQFDDFYRCMSGLPWSRRLHNK